MTTDDIVIPRRFNGPPDSGNGGFTAGRLAGLLPYGSAVQVTLRAPTPLDTPLNVVGAPTHLRLLDGDTLIAEAVGVDPSELGAAVPHVDVATARAAMTRFDGLREHPFPTCFACGTARPHVDGLGLFAGALESPRDHGEADRGGPHGDEPHGDEPQGDEPEPDAPDRAADPSRTATVFEPRSDVVQSAIGTGASAIIGPEIIWAALDCPGGWTLGLPGRPAVLGRITAEVRAMPSVGEECVVVGQLDGRRGRKAFTRTCAYGADGRELGRAAAVWIEIARD